MKNIPDLLTSYLQDKEDKEPQYQIAVDINDAKGWQYITPMAISFWIRGIHPPTIKTCRTILDATTPGSKLWALFDAIIKVLETERVQA